MISIFENKQIILFQRVVSFSYVALQTTIERDDSNIIIIICRPFHRHQRRVFGRRRSVVVVVLIIDS